MIQPTIGRKVWYYGGDGNVRDSQQAFDATVVYVHPMPPGRVNLLVVDHAGQPFVREYVELCEPSPGDSHSGGPFATWMPYQIGQARAAGA